MNLSKSDKLSIYDQFLTQPLCIKYNIRKHIAIDLASKYTVKIKDLDYINKIYNAYQLIDKEDIMVIKQYIAELEDIDKKQDIKMIKRKPLKYAKNHKF